MSDSNANTTNLIDEIKNASNIHDEDLYDQKFTQLTEDLINAMSTRDRLKFIECINKKTSIYVGLDTTNANPDFNSIYRIQRFEHDDTSLVLFPNNTCPCCEKSGLHYKFTQIAGREYVPGEDDAHDETDDETGDETNDENVNTANNPV